MEASMSLAKIACNLLCALAAMTLGGVAAAHDESKYPDWAGQWKRPRGLATQWDQTKPAGLGQQAPLKPKYQKMLEDSMADQANGGQGVDTRHTRLTHRLPRGEGGDFPNAFGT